MQIKQIKSKHRLKAHLQSQLGPTDSAFETATMEESEILQRADPVHLVHYLVTSKASALVEVRPVHSVCGSCHDILTTLLTHNHCFVHNTITVHSEPA